MLKRYDSEYLLQFHLMVLFCPVRRRQRSQTSAYTQIARWKEAPQGNQQHFLVFLRKSQERVSIIFLCWTDSVWGECGKHSISTESNSPDWWIGAGDSSHVQVSCISLRRWVYIAQPTSGACRRWSHLNSMKFKVWMNYCSLGILAQMGRKGRPKSQSPMPQAPNHKRFLSFSSVATICVKIN